MDGRRIPRRCSSAWWWWWWWSSSSSSSSSCTTVSGRRSSGRGHHGWIAWKHATTPLAHSIVRLLCYILTAAVLPSAVKGTIPTYYASNCYEVGGGNMGPLYLKCAGCQYTEAFECLETLRANTSKNVPIGCGINILTVQPDPICCPVFEDSSNHRSLDSSTSAYPDALLCLENAGCEGDSLHTAITEECMFNQCYGEYACVAAYSGSGRRSPPALGVAVALAIAVARIPLVGYGPGG